MKPKTKSTKNEYNGIEQQWCVYMWKSNCNWAELNGIMKKNRKKKIFMFKMNEIAKPSLAIPYNCFWYVLLCSPSSIEQQKKLKYHSEQLYVCRKGTKTEYRKDPIIANDRCIHVNVLVLVCPVLHRSIASSTKKCIVTNTLQCSAVVEEDALEHTLFKRILSCEKRNKNTIFFLIAISHPSILHHYFIQIKYTFEMWELKSKNNLLTKK